MELQKVKKTAIGILLFFTLSGLCGCGSRSEEPVLLEQHQQQNQQEIEEAEEEQDEENNEEQLPVESEMMPEEEDSEVLSEFDIRNKDVWKMPICEDSRILIKYMDGPQPGNTEHKPADDWYHDISYSGFTPGDEDVEVLDFGGDEIYFVMANPEYGGLNVYTVDGVGVCWDTKAVFIRCSSEYDPDWKGSGARVTVTGDLDFHYRIKYDQLTYEAQSAAGVQVLMEDWEVLVQ